MVRFGVLGPLAAEDERGPVDLKGLRHRAVLARLLVARGRVVPVGRLIDDLWDDGAPEGALGAVQTFVGALRKALEPDRPPRAPARLLVTVPPGYALRSEPDAVDAWRFESAVSTSAGLLGDGRFEDARVLLDEVLGLWRGPAYAEFAEQDWARGEAARLDEVRLLAVERRAEAALALGKTAESVPDLQAHVARHPLREDGRRLLALALYRAGRQGEALATLRQAREVLRAELGIDPGPSLRRLETDILAQAPHLTTHPTSPPLAPPPAAAHQPPSTPSTAEPPAGPSAPLPHLPVRSTPLSPGSPSNAAHGPPHRGVQPNPWPVAPSRSLGHPFVGRTGELAELERASAALAGRPRLALISGTAGAGKTALAGTLAERLAAAGWTTAWGACPELQGAPAAWPWTRMRETLAAAGHEPPPPTETSAEDPVAARFHRHRAIGSYLASVAAHGPVLLVFDDLHWADEETLALLTALAADPGTGPVLLLGTYRSTEISPGLAEALGRAARTEPTRVYLGGLTEPQVRQLVDAITDRTITAADARTIHVRSAGNPFFVRELTRLWETEGDAALRTVPAGVRDVIRHRLAKLTGTAQTHLRQASVLGQDVDLDVLIPLAGDEDAVLDSLESALLAGFLVEQNADRLRFAHALVRETLYDDITRARRARWHATAADVVENARPHDVEAIAHHLLRAGNRATAARTAHYTRAAAERAERRFAPHQAVSLWRETVAALDRDGQADPRARVEAVMGTARALAVTGDLEQARRYRAEVVAEVVGDPVVAARTIGSFDVPAIWTTNDDEALSERLVAAAERTLTALPPGHEAERARLLVTIAMERRADTGRRGLRAAREAEAIARERDDPSLLALALNGRFMQTFHRAGLAPDRARTGEELLDLAGRHGLVTFEVLGHLILVQAKAALADLPAADRHAVAADALAERHDLPLVGVFTTWYAALRLAVTGRRDEARTAYRAAATRLTGTGMSGVERGILPLALLSLGEVDDTDWGPYEPWARPFVLLGQGKRAEALAAVIPDSPHDLLFEARTCLHAVIAIEAGDRTTVERLYTKLLPASGELAGAGSGLVAFGPTAHHLANLAAALGWHDQAAEHRLQAQAITDGVPLWTDGTPGGIPGSGR